MLNFTINLLISLTEVYLLNIHMKYNDSWLLEIHQPSSSNFSILTINFEELLNSYYLNIKYLKFLYSSQLLEFLQNFNRNLASSEQKDSKIFANFYKIAIKDFNFLINFQEKETKLAQEIILEYNTLEKNFSLQLLQTTL